jgi:predicted nuclease of predicted toxin-antitoxin system
MVRVLLDACVPHWLRRELTEFAVETAHFAGLDHLSDTDLLDAIEGRYAVLVTLDRNLTYQQKIEKRSVAVIILRVAEQTPETFQALVPQLRAAVRSAAAGSIAVVGVPG